MSDIASSISSWKFKPPSVGTSSVIVTSSVSCVGATGAVFSTTGNAYAEVTGLFFYLLLGALNSVVNSNVRK